jgi:hypothetical protein
VFWIFASVCLILLVVSTGFRKAAGGITLALFALFLLLFIKDSSDSADSEDEAVATQEPDPCNGNIGCLLDAVEQK